MAAAATRKATGKALSTISNCDQTTEQVQISDRLIAQVKLFSFQVFTVFVVVVVAIAVGPREVQ